MKVHVRTLEEWAYDRETKELQVVYHDRVCRYYHVPRFLYHELLMAEEPACYIRKHIHPYFRMEESVRQ